MQRYRDVVLNIRGEPVPGVSVLVKTFPGGVNASLFDDDSGTTLDNPLPTDSNGAFSFKAANGHYSLSFSGTGITAQTVSDITLCDPDDVITDALADLAEATGAAAVGFAPAGGLSASTVQAALVELDTEKASLAALAASDGTTKVNGTWFGAVVATVAQLASSVGASLLGYGTDSVAGALDALRLADYTALRAYAGAQTSVYVTGYLGSAAPSGIAGVFVRDDTDTTSADNGGTIIVAANGKRWKRAYLGVVLADWFGADPSGVADSYAAIVAARGAAKSVQLGIGTYKSSGSIDLDGSTYDGFTLSGAGRGATIINYTGSDYFFRINTDDSVGNVVRRAKLSAMTISGSASALGAIRLRNSSENGFEDLYITGFTNAAAIIIDSNSTSDYAWGQRWRNVTVKYNAGAAIAMRLNKFTDTIFDGIYLSNNGNIGLQIGSGNGLRMIGGAIESHTYGVVVSTGINAASGEPPTSAIVLLGLHLENNKYHIDINNAYSVGSERVYNFVCDSIINGAVAPANDVPITVGFATDTMVRDTFIHSPNLNGLSCIDIKSVAVNTRVKSTRYIPGRPDVADAGTGSQIDRLKQIYTPAWTVSSGTAPAIGNGALSADYTQEGALVTANITLLAGSTTTFGTGVWRLSLPFKANPANRSIGQAVVHQSSTNKDYAGTVYVDNTTNTMRIALGSNTFPTDYQNPFNWANGDRMDITITYPILSV